MKALSIPDEKKGGSMKTSTIDVKNSPAKTMSGRDAGLLIFTLIALIGCMIGALRIGFEANLIQHELNHTQEHVQEMKTDIQQMESKSPSRMESKI